MSSQNSLRELVALLRELMVSSPTERSDLERWYSRARDCEALLKRSRDLDDVAPHAIWHYLTDADIRVKDPTYHEAQQAEIAEILANLESLLPVDAA